MLIELAPVVGYGSAAIYLATPEYVEPANDEPTSMSAGAHRIGTVRLLSDLHDVLTSTDVDVDDRAIALLSKMTHAPQGLDDDRVTLGDVEAAYEALRSFLRVQRESGAEAVGLVDVSPAARRPGLLRSWPDAAEPIVLAHRRHGAVRQRGLQLDLHFSDGQAPIDDIRSFSLGIEGGVVKTGAGESVTVDRNMTRALCGIADGATAWRVRTVPSVLVWAGMLEGLEAAAASLREAVEPALIMVSDELASVLSVAE